MEPAAERAPEPAPCAPVERPNDSRRAPEHGPPRAARARTLGAAAALLALALAAYAPVLGAWFLADDFFVLEITRPEPPWRRFLLPQYLFLDERFEAVQMHGRPFLLATYAAQQAVSGLAAAPMRAVNVLALAWGGWLVLALARERVELRGASAWLAAALYVLHPEHVDGVAWIAGRGAPLSTALVLAALVAWSRGRRALPAALFVLALGTYELAVAFPLLVLALDGRRALRDPWLVALLVLDGAFCVLQLFFLSEVPRVGWTSASPIHALRHAVQLVVPFFDSPRWPAYNVAAKDWVRERVALLGPLAALAAAAGVLTLARVLRGRERAAVRALVLAAAIALVPAVAYGHFSPRTSMLASAFVALLVARALRRRPAWLAVYVLALGCATLDECRFWREGAAHSRAIVRAAAAGAPVDPPQHHHKLVPLFPGRETLETALRVFPAGPP